MVIVLTLTTKNASLIEEQIYCCYKYYCLKVSAFSMYVHMKPNESTVNDVVELINGNHVASFNGDQIKCKGRSISISEYSLQSKHAQCVTTWGIPGSICIKTHDSGSQGQIQLAHILCVYNNYSELYHHSDICK